MNFNQLIKEITPEIYLSLKRAVEIGKWPDGRVLTTEQRELCMQAVIAYEAEHIDERARTGFIDRGSKEQGEFCDDEQAPASNGDQSDQPVKWLH
jgi:uncharacterized protein YeaC (DUF1315 family)